MQDKKTNKESSQNIECTVYRLKQNKDIQKNIIDKNNRTLTINDPDELDECIFMHSLMFSKIFGITWKSMSAEERLLPIVKITYKNDCIYRRYRQCSADGLTTNKVGLTQRSISLLSPKENIVGSLVELSVGNHEDFFKMHPNHATRMSYNMSIEGNKLGEEANELSRFSKSIGIWSIIFGVASFIISIVSLCIAL